MQITPEELGSLLSKAAEHPTDIAQLRERMLKMEHKLNELYDMLTDFRVNQIMGSKKDEIIKEYFDTPMAMSNDSEAYELLERIVDV